MTILDAIKPREDADPAAGNIFSVTSLNSALDTAQAKLTTSVDADPEKAAQSIPIAKDLDIDPRAVASDFDTFQRTHGLAAASMIVGENPYLVNYINTNPMASKVSNDDYGALHDVSKSMEVAGQKGFLENTGDIYKGIWRSFTEGPEAYRDLVQGYKDAALKLKMDPAMADAQAQAFAGRAWRNEAFTNLLFALPMAMFAPALGAFQTYISQPLERETGFPAEATEALTMSGLAFLGLKGKVGADVKLQQTVRTTEPFINEGKPVPVGADEVIDKVHIEQAKMDLKALREAVSAAQKSATRERAPELFESFLKQHGDREIGVSVETLRVVFGDELKGLEWLPKLPEQVALAERTGSDVKIPLSGLLTYADKEQVKSLEDFIRYRDGGMTVEEAKAGIEVYHGSPHEFEAFDLGKAGTGEGAQSYGFGHYLAESSDVAQQYAQAGKVAKSITSMPETDREIIRKVVNATPEEREAILRAVPKEQSQRIYDFIQQNASNVYRARILRQPEEFLDWDKPLNEQSPEHQAILKALGVVEGEMETFDKGVSQGKQPVDISTALASLQGEGGEAAVSKKLSEAGIAGIKYLDQFSRKASYTPEEIAHEIKIREDQITTQKEIYEAYKGAPDNPMATNALEHIKSLEKEIEDYKTPAEKLTRNFVVFRDEDIQVIERNGEAVAALRRASGLTPKAYAKPTVAPDITKAVYEKYAKLLEEQRADDRAYYEKIALRNAKRTQTKAWKENEIAVRAEVVQNLKTSPAFAADTFFRDGKVGDEVLPKPKLGEAYLTPEETAAIPKQFVTKGGMPPDEAAAMTGHRTGKELIADLAKWETDRKAAGMGPMIYRRRLVDAEVEKQMQIRHGVLKDNIIEDAKKQVLSRIEEDKLQEEAVIEAVESGADYAAARQHLEASRAAAIEAFENSPLKDAKSDAYLATIGRIDRKVEGAMLKDDVRDAFTQRERKFVAAVLGRRAIEIEDIAESLTKTAKKYSGRDLPKVERATVNYVRGLLSQAGLPLKVLPEEIARAIQEEGGTFQSYLKAKADLGWDPTVSDRIVTDGPGKLKEMTVAEFREFAAAIDSLDDIGRKMNQINIRGQAMDFAEWKKEVRDNLQKRPVRSIEETEAGGKWTYRLEAPWTRMEEFAKDVDFRAELGPFYEALIVPYEMAKSDGFKTLKDSSAQMQGLKAKGFDEKWYRGLSEEVPNDFIHDMWNNSLFKMTKWNVIKLALNLGNKGNAKTLFDGIARAGMEAKAKPTPEQLAMVELKVRKMIDEHLTKEDLQFVQHMWDLFDQYRDRIYRLNYVTGGKEVKFVEPQELTTAHGTFKGGYFPLIPDRNRNINIGAKAPEAGGLLGNDFFRANTNQSHLIARTGARYFVDITGGPEQLVGRLQQVIHDLAYREFAIEAGKIIYDPEVQHMLKKYYGKEYQQLLEPWAKRVTNAANAPEIELEGWNDVLRRFRMNLIAYALPLNYAVEFSPSVGTANLKGLFEFNANRAMNKELVMKHSKELEHTMYSLDRDVQESLNRALSKGKYTSFQIHAMETMFKPLVWLEQQFRMATFYKEFMKQKGEGRSDYEASVLGDSLIRERHGVGAVGDLPMIMSHPNEFVKIATVFMGYFNSQRNWMRQIPHNVREGDYSAVAKILWSTVAVNALVNAALFERRKKDDTFFSFMGRAALSTPFMMVPYVRDAWTYYSEGYRPTASVLSAMLSVGELMKDGYKVTQRKPLKHAIRDVASVAGQAFGVPGALQAGRTGQFFYDVGRGQQHPHGFTEWMRGMFTGKSQLER